MWIHVRSHEGARCLASEYPSMTANINGRRESISGAAPLRSDRRCSKNCSMRPAKREPMSRALGARPECSQSTKTGVSVDRGTMMFAGRKSLCTNTKSAWSSVKDSTADCTVDDRWI